MVDPRDPRRSLYRDLDFSKHCTRSVLHRHLQVFPEGGRDVLQGFLLCIPL